MNLPITTLIIVLLLNCPLVMGAETERINGYILDKEECLRIYEHVQSNPDGNVWQGLMWDDEKQMCYAKLTSATTEWVKVYIDKDYHLTVEQGEGWE